MMFPMRLTKFAIALGAAGVSLTGAPGLAWAVSPVASVRAADATTPAATSTTTTSMSMTCNGVFSGTDGVDPHVSASDGSRQLSAGAPVYPGDTITVTVTWTAGATASKLSNCAETVTGNKTAFLSGTVLQAPPAIDQPAQFTVTVPTQVGSSLCDRAAIDDNKATSTQKSTLLCFSIQQSAVLPESPVAILLPVSAVTIGAGALVFGRRRKGRSAPIA